MESRTAKRKQNICNLHLCQRMSFSGNYDMPEVDAYCGSVPNNFLPFNQALSSTDFDSCVHFFIDDYQFERIWRLPERYLSVLKRFRCLMAPDFSLFVDVPRAVNVWNVYRNRVITKWLQNNNVSVIPCVSWGNADTLSFCFDGIPNNSILAIGRTAYGRNPSQSDLFFYGLQRLVELKRPKHILLYGQPFNTEIDNITFIKDFLSELKQYGKREKTHISEA